MNRKLQFALCILTLCLVFSMQANAQNSGAKTLSGREMKTKAFSKIAWSTVRMDSTWDKKFCEDFRCVEIIGKYKPAVDKLEAPIGKCPAGLTRDYPEGPLGNWTVDLVHRYAQNYLDTTGRGDMKIDFALINSGGIRADMPAGNISRLDIITIYPFDNYMVIVSLPGKSVRLLMELFAKTKVQVMSNVELVIEDKEVGKCLINGCPIDEDKVYNVATIDFLLNGGDGVYPLAKNVGVIGSKVKVMDLITASIEDLSKAGKLIEKQKDGRAIIKNQAK